MRPVNLPASSMCQGLVWCGGIDRQRSVSKVRRRRMCSNRSVTLSLVSQSQSCLLEGCRQLCCSKAGNHNGMYFEICKKINK